jgi:hypothetical protein
VAATTELTIVGVVTVTEKADGPVAGTAVVNPMFELVRDSDSYVKIPHVPTGGEVDERYCTTL